jgi:hypothetical protein
MQRAMTIGAEERGEQMKFYLLFGAAYPLFLAAEATKRALAHRTSEAKPESPRSLFAEARETTSIAISFALMARTTLHTFARPSRTERLS